MSVVGVVRILHMLLKALRTRFQHMGLAVVVHLERMGLEVILSSRIRLHRRRQLAVGARMSRRLLWVEGLIELRTIRNLLLHFEEV
jgi:hypothetical protein